MFELNGSETDWLVYAEYLEDQGIDAIHIREGVVNPQTNQWMSESGTAGKVGMGFIFKNVGCYTSEKAGSIYSFNDAVGTQNVNEEFAGSGLKPNVGSG